MRIARWVLGGLIASSALVGCGRGPASPGADPGEVVGAFLADYRGDFRRADPALLSAALSTALRDAATAEKQSAARIKASAFPSDKPLLLEGEIFSGLYEGFTDFEVGAGRTVDGRAEVEVRFRNRPYEVAWTDEFHLVEENGWKIDDVRYADKKAGLLGLREVLQDFEVAVAAEAAALSAKP